VVDELRGGVETQPLIPHVATAKLDVEFVAITAPNRPTINTNATAKSRVFNFN
jgi:hypothetical protein